MSTRSKEAIALYRWLETEWDAMEIAPTAWCRKVGFSDATVLRWRDGIESDLRTLKRLAVALERPLLDVLVKAGYVKVNEVGEYQVPPRTYDLLETIRLDPNLTDGEREALRQIHDAFALVGTGRRRKVTVRGVVD